MISPSSGGSDYCQAALNTDDEVQRVQNRMDSGLTLVQVQLLTRHGDRAPIEYLHSPVYNDTAYWDCKIDRLSYENYENKYTTQNRLTSERFMPGREANLGNCGMGSLTQKGSNQHIKNGEKFRSMYIDTAKFLPENWDSQSVYLRSGNELRLVESAQSVLVGLYPPKELNPHEERQNVDLIDGNFDDMTPSITDVCRLGSIIEDINYDDAAYRNFTQYRVNVTDQLDDIFQVGGISLYGMSDLIRSRGCHDFDYTYGGLLSPDLIEEILQLSLYDFIFYPNNTLANRYGMGSFLWEMFNYFDEFVAKQNNYKLVYFSGHDSSVFPLLNTLKLFDGLWPPLASNVLFEYWQNNTNGEYLVEIIYNGRSITKYLADCGGGDTCSYNLFRKITKPVTVSLDEFWKECAIVPDDLMRKHKELIRQRRD